MPELELIASRDDVELARFRIIPGSYTIGRSKACELYVKADGVSREHAKLELCADGAIWIEDLGSVNGLSLDGETVSGRTSVQPNQVVQMGAVSLLIQS